MIEPETGKNHSIDYENGGNGRSGEPMAISKGSIRGNHPPGKKKKKNDQWDDGSFGDKR
jgi:hypothetical protein